jgi:XTP/dITP diphosphohydrolase
MRLSNKVLLATQNRGKYQEFRSLFTAYPEVELVMATDVLRNTQGLGFVERHDTYLANAVAKARLVNQGAHYPSLADDSGLEVMALEGKPGVRSHRFASPRPDVSQDEANNQFLLKELTGKSSREARFVCTLALLIEGILIHATGTLEGTIADSPRGTYGFGYDPLFIPKGATRTLAEMTESEKNAVSHRAKALHALMEQVKTHGLVFAKP